MKVVILAAGRGSRMEKYTETTTKAMLLLNEKPILQITIENCIKCGLKDFVIVVGYRKEDIINYFGNGNNWEINIEYITQPNIKAGTADAVRWIEKSFENHYGKFLLVYGDVIPSVSDIRVLMENSTEDYSSGTMGVRIVENPEQYGVVQVEGQEVKKILEKTKNPPCNLINAGVYILPFPCVFDQIRKTKLSPRGEFELTDSIQHLIENGISIKWKKIDGVKDIGTKEVYSKVK